MAATKNLFLKRIAYGFSILAMLMIYFPNMASAAQITARSVTIGSSAASANTTYAFTFTVPTSLAIKSVGFAACTTASGACTPAPGFSASTSTLTGQPVNLGVAAGWTVSTATPGELRLSNGSNATVPSGAITVGFSNVTNPSATNATFFLRMTTYSLATWATPIDTGVVAASTAGQVTVTAAVDETLTFTLATATVALGTLSSAATNSGTSSMTAATNGGTGYSITVAGNTLTSGTNTIAALASPTASLINNPQYGLNLMLNTTPAVGAIVTGTGSGVAATGYNIANSYKFVSGDTVASATLPTNSNVYTSSYIANISGATAAGAYSTVMNYVATANF